MGDSNSANPYGVDVSINGYSNTSTGWFAPLCMLSGQRIRNYGDYSRASYTSRQVVDAKLSTILALDPLPGAVFGMVGTNDAGLDGAFILSAASDAIEGAIQRCLAVGVLDIPVFTIPDGRATGAIKMNQQKLNKRVLDLAAEYRLPCVDAYSPLVDVTTGNIKSIYAPTSDSLHMNSRGRRVLASAILDQGIAN